jgi:hypothetical protein
METGFVSVLIVTDPSHGEVESADLSKHNGRNGVTKQGNPVHSRDTRMRSKQTGNEKRSDHASLEKTER